MDWSSGCYTLYAPQTGKGLVKLISITSDTVHEWNLPVRPGRDAVILPNGNLGYNGSHEESANLYPAWDIWHGGHFMQMNPKGDIVWEHEDIYHHHDAQWLENGNLLYAAATPTPSRWELGISDIIKEVNREIITTVESFIKLIIELKKTGRNSILLRIIRDEKSLWVTTKFSN